MKPKNKIKRLKARQDAWEAIRATSSNGENKKSVNKQEYTKPGSFKR